VFEGQFHGLFFFEESTVTGIVCLEMLHGWLKLQLKKDIPNLIY
jgi:hypothetical protein